MAVSTSTENILIEFTTDATQLDTALDTLERTGQVDKASADQLKKTNAELQKRSKLLADTGKAAKASTDQVTVSVEELDAVMQAFFADFTKQMEEELRAGLKEAGVEFDEFGKVINKTNQESVKSSKSLKGELRALTQELATMKLRGEDNTDQYREMAMRAGEMKDALADAGQEVANFGSDTRALDGLIGVAQGVTAGFQVAAGAEALFGTQSEELQETLLRVNSLMAVTQGLQEIGNFLQKESAGATFLQTTALKIYNIVIGESIGLTAAFRIALAATGVGVVVIAILALVSALKKQDAELERVNAELERNKNIIDADREAIERLAEQEEARAAAANKSESEITRIRGRSLNAQRRSIEEANALLDEQRKGLDRSSEAFYKINNAIEANNSLIDEIDNKIAIEKINLDKQLKEEQLQRVVDVAETELASATKNSKSELEINKRLARAKSEVELNSAGDNAEKRLLIEANLQKEVRDLDRAFAQVRQQDRISAAENELLKIQQHNRSINERVNQEEVDAQKKVIKETARLALLQEGLTENQKIQIRNNSFNEQLQLQKDFNKQSTIESLNDEISRNNASLTNIRLTEQEKFDIQADSLVAQSQIEIEENKGLADKIKEIRKKLQEDLRNLRLQFLQKELNDELSLTASRTGILQRANERIAANENKSLLARVTAINQLAALDIAVINKKQDALDQQLQEGLISQREYNVQYAALKDEEEAIAEETEIKKRELTKETNRRNVELALNTGSQVLDIISQFGQQQTDAEQNRINAQRTEIDELREAGVITEREAIARQKKLDNEERALKRRQAERDKAIALFQAVINTAAAIVKALPNLVLAGIAAALGAAQIALISSRPIPKFGRGKKGSYQGPAEIGETGAELVQTGEGLYLAPKRTIVWLGKRDKVFNPKETAAMLEKNNMRPYVIKDNDKYNPVYNNYNIDYKKLGKVIGENIPRTGLNVDSEGFTEWVQSKNTFNRYLDNRRSY